MDEYDVTVIEASLVNSEVSGQSVITLVFLPHELCFLRGKVVSNLYCRVSNVHPLASVRRARLRVMLGLVGLDEPFTDEELESMIGRHLRVRVETVEFEGVLRLRVVDFLRCSGTARNLNYSDNEYVFMMRGLLQAEEGGEK